VYHSVLADARLYEFLTKIDQDLAAKTKLAGCLDGGCGGRLDVANYPRKPRGARERALGDEYQKRLSFCCRNRDCRTRATPPSVRFLGRRVYLGTVVVVAAAMRQGTSPWRLAKLRELFGVSPDTLARWRVWWQEVFPQTRGWKAQRGRFHLPVEPARLPTSLLERYRGDLQTRLVHVLRFLEPVTSSWAAAHAFGGRA
jgi:hypothetical protein